MKNIKGIIYGLISSSAFGLIPFLSIPLMVQSHMGLPTMLFYRFLFSSLMMETICLIRKESFKISQKNILIVCCLAMLFAITSICFFSSYKYIPTGLATTIHFLYPVAVSILMVVFFKERRSMILLLTAVVSLIGVGLLCWSGEGHVNLVGVALVAVTIVTYAIYIVVINQSSVRAMNPGVLTFYILLSVAVLFFIFAVLTPDGIEPIPDISALSRLLLLAFLPTVVSAFTLILAIKYAGSTITSILGSMEPLIAVLIGVLHFSEPFNMSSAFGILLILFSVSLVIVFGRPKKRSSTVSHEGS